ncbi:hypothetical protein UFOVP221_137 [uncultured Caudovirales phage]|uniref:Uncharacterized protein n=1 Tax=uncultured Caudovirales phage TaxID=2100421 RepID=A0A6J7WSG5_9CAUD|nr:hypothetical protein UFOVP221_137 [uncultured Caudovirales phage]
MLALIRNIKYRKQLHRLHTAYIRALSKPTSPRRQALLKQEQAR